ncbi:hypothetical protein HPB47_025467 [Ixodes persulcatus]|uniref:Uncharacterized protein n=1 Tax=Ixodes persulcatus TaxID=34615 RepID=A0AC60Q2N7_IXOPE|nr:hypothetical protein HPB47_025467 [Ixodes persulcatus]
MAARVARASFARCVQINSHKCRISRSFSASHLLLVRGTNQRTAHNLDLETEAAADDDFFGVASERDVVTVPGSESFTRDRLEKFEHLARSRDARVSDVKVIDAGFGTIRYDSDNQPSLQKFTKRDRSEKIVTERPGNRSRAGSIAPNHLEGADDSQPPDSEEQQTAYDYLRRESPPSSVKLDSKGFRILKSEIRPDLSRLLHSEAVNLLQKRVLYNDNDILVLNKPYGMLCHGPAPEVSDACVLTKLLPDLSSALYPRQDAKLYTVHRLDRDVTGVLLLARTQRMADTLNSLFQKHRKLPGDMLDRLGIRQSKVRDTPLHLHARAVVVPEILDGRNLTVAAEVPYHFAKNLRRLKLNRN